MSEYSNNMTLWDCRSEVQQFALEMERRLREKDEIWGKTGWRQMDFLSLLEKHEAKVQDLNASWNYSGWEYEKRRAPAAVDLANMTMMLWDVNR